jgi:hypothetical protein
MTNGDGVQALAPVLLTKQAPDPFAARAPPQPAIFGTSRRVKFS